MRALRSLFCLGSMLALAACSASYEGSASYRAPYAPGGEARTAERYGWFVPNQIETTASRPVSAFSLDVDSTGYVTARRYIHDNSFPPKQAVKAAEFLNYFDYGYDKPDSAAAPFKISSVIAPNPWNPDTKLLHIGIKAYEAPPASLPPLRLILAVDTSEKMAAPDRLPLLSSAVAVLAGSLSTHDQVAVVAFGSEAKLVLPPTAGSDASQIKDAIAKLKSEGKSMGAAGLDLAYQTATGMFDRNAVNLVVLISGGEFDDLWDNKRRGSSSLTNMIWQQRDNGIGLRVLGVGSKTLNASLLQDLSSAGRSKSAYADNEAEAVKFFTSELGERRLVVAREALANVEFNPTRVAEYRLIGYELNQSSNSAQGGAAHPGIDIASGQEATILYEITEPGSPARRIQPLRYTHPTTSEADPRYAAEVAYVRVGYRLPSSSRRQTFVRAVTSGDERPDLASTPPSARFAIAVAAYAEKLRNDGYIGDDFTFKQIADLARGSNLADPFGQKREFIDLAEQASSLTCYESRHLSADCH